MGRLTLCSATLILLTLIASGQSRQCLPPAVAHSSEANIFTEQQENDLGDAIAEHLQRNFRVIDDEEVTGHLNQIGQRIVKHLPQTSLRFQFLLVDMPDANAFVLPGGRVYVARKLVALAQSEDELAGVIAHEIGHLVARQGSIDLTRILREVLGVTEVKDRKDIFDKYNQLMENAARKPRAFERDDREKGQLVADQIGLFAVAGAGYDPQAQPKFFDRITENKGKTGGFFSNLFGTTRPESRRLREMIKGSATLPPECIESRAAASADEFQRWQAAVVNYTGLGRKEVLHGVLSKKVLEPPLRGEITHLRFSPDGKYLLAQDDSGINVLSREPFAPLFRIEAAEAKQAQFSPDSQDIVLYNSDLRVEVWSVADQKIKTAHELFVRKGCLQTSLSPDGKTLACLDGELGIDLFDVATGEQTFQKKSFYVPSLFDLFFTRLMGILNEEERNDTEVDWLNMGFSPDGHYFAVGAKSTIVNGIGGLATEANALAVDLTTRQPVSLRGSLKKFLADGFTFVAPDRVIGIDRSDSKKSAMVSFPAGEVLELIPIGIGRVTKVTRGNYLLIRPIAKYPVGVMDLEKKTIFKASKTSAIDIYDQMFVSERVNGKLALYGVEKNDLLSEVALPRSPLGRLRASALTPDFGWLAVSERQRGAVWNLPKGEQTFHVRGFRGAHFGDDNALYADFPKFEEAERGIARLDLMQGNISRGPELKDAGARQYGPLVLITRPAKKDGSFSADVIMDASYAGNLVPLWSKPFPKEAPAFWVEPAEGTMVLSWPVSAAAAKAEIKSDARLSQQVSSMKEKEGDYFLQVLDQRTGKFQGRLLIETGKGSFRISRVFAAGDWVVVSDTQNRVLVYSLSTGEQKGRVFGARAAASKSSGLLCVENEKGQLTVYDLNSMEKRDQFTFSSPISLTRFSPDGQSLFVLTANQTAYVLDLSSIARRKAS